MLVLGVLAMLQIRHATRAQIMAVLPPSLKVVERRDLAGEKRLLRLEALAKRLSNPIVSAGFGVSATAQSKRRAVDVARPILAEVERELTGTLWRPSRPDAMDGFPKAASLKFLLQVLALTATEAADRKDRPACARYALLGLRLSDRLLTAGGGLIDLFVSEAVEAIAEKAAVDVDAKDGLDDRDRRRVLALLTPLGAPTPELGRALRHEFTSEWLPLLMDPVHGSKMPFGPYDFPVNSRLSHRSVKLKEGPQGNFDPLATARLMGAIFDAEIQDASRPFTAQMGLANRFVAAAGKGLPDADDNNTQEYWSKMNAIPNSIGRQLVSWSVVEGLTKSETLRATRRNLARAAILQRHGEYSPLPDPFGKGSLKIDAKRRIVYSVGENGRDDGGQIGKGFTANAPDFGYRY